MKKIFIASVCFGFTTICVAQVKNDSIATTIRTESITATRSYVSLPKKVLEEVQVNALRGSAKAPFSKTKITDLSGSVLNLGQDLPFLLQYTPSVIINSDAGNGVGYTGIRIRGTDATRINMTINGVPYNDAESQGLFFVNLPDFASSVNSVEIQRGVGSSSNGAGAFGATMSFSTNNFSDKAYIELNNSFGSFNTLKNTLKFGTGLKNKLYFDGRISHIRSDGFIDRATSNLQSAMATIGFLHKNTDLKFNAIIGKEKTYQAWYGVNAATLASNRTFNSAGTERAINPYENETDNYKQNHFQLILNQKINQYWKFSTTSFYTKGSGYYEQYKAMQEFSKYGLPNLNTTETTTDLVRQLWLDNDFYGQTFAAIFNKKKNNITIGGMISKYVGNHFGQIPWAEKGIIQNHKYYDTDAFKDDNNVYTKWQHDIDSKLTIYSDVQYRNVQYNINGFRNNPNLLVNKTYNFINPKFGISYNYNKTSASISYAKAAKEPNRDDFEASTTQLPLPEKLHDWELNVTQKVSSKLKTTATAYYMQYNNQLILTGKINDVGAYTRQNVANSYRTGLELQANYSHSKKFTVAGNLTLSSNKVKNFTEYIDNYDAGGQNEIVHKNTNIAFSPNVIGTISASTNVQEKLYISLISKYVGRQYLDNTQNMDRSLQPYYLQDVLFVFQPKIKQLNKVEVILQANNIFNKKYEPNGYTFSYFAGGSTTTENFYFPMAGTNFMLGVNIKL